MKIKILEISVFLSLFVCIVGCISFENDCEQIRQSVLRLHVIASSDTDEDQRLKLKVRDVLLEKGGDIFAQNDGIVMAQEKVKNNLDTLKETAEKAVREMGYSYPVEVKLGESYFPTKQYENITLPAGKYNAVKVIIGEGEGKNWWCVMFPPMCLPAASKNEAQLSDVLSEKGMDIVTGERKYEVRFWIVEKYQELVNRWRAD